MIDTHTHLYMKDAFPDGGEAAVSRAINAGVSHMVLLGVDVDSVNPMLDLHSKFPEHTSVCIGLHPTELTSDWRHDLEEIRYRIADTPYVAWGEIGLDLHWEKNNLSRQMDAFGFQMDEAFSESKPVIIHSRDALEETLEVIRLMGNRRPPLLFHSFTSGPDALSRILEECPDALFGINGVVTFKNAPDLREAVARAGIHRIVLETDAPYLAPVPHRGSTNESSFLPHILDAVAGVVGTSPDEVNRITDQNACNYFGIQTL